MKMRKRVLTCMAVALFALTCHAVDYANHMYTYRIFRVALGSGTAPSASDVSNLRVHNGDMILNTDDSVLYIMHASNVYTKVTAAGAMTVESFASANVTGNAVIGGTLACAGTATFDGAGIYGQDGSGTNTIELILSGTHRGRISIMKDLILGYGGANAASGDILCYDAGNTNVFKLDSSDRKITMIGEIEATSFDGDGSDLTDLDAANLTAGTVASAIDGSAITNIAAGNIASGTLSNDRLDADLGKLAGNDGSSLTNLNGSNIASGTVDNDRLDADLAKLAGNDGSSLTNIPTSALEVEADVKSVLDCANDAAIRSAIDVPAKSDVFGSCDITIGDLVSGQLISTNTIELLDVAGTAKSDYALIRVWTSETAYGPASTNNIEALTLSTGTQIEEVVANGDYWYVTASDGTAVATITGTAPGTNYLNVSVGANVTSEEIVLVP